MLAGIITSALLEIALYALLLLAATFAAGFLAGFKIGERAGRRER